MFNSSCLSLLSNGDKHEQPKQQVFSGEIENNSAFKFESVNRNDIKKKQIAIVSPINRLA